jgi:6,7-dimethyl-8-ribityllumazine synthase
MSGLDEADRRDDEPSWGEGPPDDLERASENVLEAWPSPRTDAPREDSSDEDMTTDGTSIAADAVVPGPPPGAQAEPGVVESQALDTSTEHAPGDLEIPPGYPVLEGEARGGRRAVGIVVSRFNGDVTGKLLDSALAELEARGVDQASITVMPVPGAFELPIAAMALAKTRRFACIVALGCVIRGDTPHFDYVAGEAASGLQLAAIETGVPVAFGVLTLDRPEQAEPRFDKGAEAVRSALEMADLFSNLRAAAAR